MRSRACRARRSLSLSLFWMETCAAAAVLPPISQHFCVCRAAVPCRATHARAAWRRRGVRHEPQSVRGAGCAAQCKGRGHSASLSACRADNTSRREPKAIGAQGLCRCRSCVPNLVRRRKAACRGCGIPAHLVCRWHEHGGLSKRRRYSRQRRSAHGRIQKNAAGASSRRVAQRTQGENGSPTSPSSRRLVGAVFHGIVGRWSRQYVVPRRGKRLERAAKVIIRLQNFFVVARRIVHVPPVCNLLGRLRLFILRPHARAAKNATNGSPSACSRKKKNSRGARARHEDRRRLGALDERLLGSVGRRSHRRLLDTCV